MNRTICVLFLSAGAALAGAQTSPGNPPPPNGHAHPKAAAAPPTKTPPKSRAKAASKAPVPTPRAAAPLKVPASAEKMANGSYRYADPQGKVWFYRETPFGISRTPESSIKPSETPQVVQTPFGAVTRSGAAPSAMPTPLDEHNDRVTAEATGDKIRFQRPTPFGTSSWEKKKTDLTTDEQRIWDREQAKRNQ